MNRRTVMTLAAGLLPQAALLRRAEAADPWPSRPIRMVLPFAPGTGVDAVARSMAQEAAARLGQPVVADNRAGAGTTIGNELVARAAPDGHTFLFASFAFISNQALRQDQRYDILTDFEPVSLLFGAPPLLVAHPSLPATNLAELIAYTRAQREPVHYTSSGIGSAPHLFGELLKVQAGANLEHVSFNGVSSALQATLRGDVKIFIDAILPTGAQVRDGSLRGIVLADHARSLLLPSVPSLDDSGHGELAMASRLGILLPARTPRPIVERLNDVFVGVARQPAFTERLESLGLTVFASSPEEYGEVIRGELARWTEIVRRAAVRLD